MHGAEGVEVAIGLLRGGDVSDPFIDLFLELGIGRSAEDVCRGLDGFINVGVVERIKRRRRDLEILLPAARRRITSAARSKFFSRPDCSHC